MAHSNTDTRELDGTANGGEMSVPCGSSLQLRLPESPTTGFRWNVISVGNPAVELIADRREQPPGGLGPTGSRLWLFRAAQAGTGHIELQYARPWEVGAAPAQTFTLDVRVE